MNFYVGQKVVCINNDHNAYHSLGNPEMDGLQKGAIYTVRWNGTTHHPSFGTYQGVLLNEIIRGYCPYINGETPYSAGRFRPVVEHKTNISIFKEILNQSELEEV